MVMGIGLRKGEGRFHLKMNAVKERHFHHTPSMISVSKVYQAPNSKQSQGKKIAVIELSLQSQEGSSILNVTNEKGNIHQVQMFIMIVLR